jgi:hypothetical protein
VKGRPGGPAFVVFRLVVPLCGNHRALELSER